MTIEEFMDKHKDKTMLTPNDVGEIMKIHPSNLIAYAREGKLQFPHVESGNRVKFPKGPFLRWMTTGESTKEEAIRPEVGTGSAVSINFSGDTVDDMIDRIIEFLVRMKVIAPKSQESEAVG